MITKDETSKINQFWMGVMVLAVGIAIGLLARTAQWGPEQAPAITADESTDVNSLPTPTGPPMARAEGAPAEAGNGLETLYVDLEPDAAARLQAVRDRAHARGQILQEPDDLVPATIRLGEKSVEANVRIKGDFLDHLEGDKWSLRIELRGDKLLGMSRLSIQSPATRGYLWEWLVMKTARAEGLLAPRSMFINVVVNDNPTGIFYLEEHFAKELLESQGRREGPIVRYVEDTYWGEFFQHKKNQGGTAITGPKSIEPSQYVTASAISAFGEKRLAQSEALARQLGQALAQLRTIQHMMMGQEQIPADELARIDSAIRSEGRTIESVLDVRSAADMHALLCLFRCNHALVWPNRRFYHNPVTDRLEPIVFDTLAGIPSPNRDPIGMATWTVREFLKSPAYYNRVFERVGELTRPEFLESMFEENEAELRKYAKLLRDEGYVVPETDVEVIKNQLYDQQVYLRELLRPDMGVNFDCRFVSEEAIGGPPTGTIVVEAWATTRIPVVLEGFRFGNDRFVGARGSLAVENPPVSFVEGRTEGVVLPNDGRHVTFAFPIDERLATLRDIAEIKNTRQSGQEPDLSVKLAIMAEYFYLGSNAERREALSIRRIGAGWESEGGRPEPPSLRGALERHAFLSYDEASGRLSVDAGEWDVEGDLVVPNGYALHVGPGVTLRFGEGAVVSEDALMLEGSEENPIVLETRRGGRAWAGVVVLGAQDRSSWRHVRVSDTDVITRGGWILTGGVTFYRTPVDVIDCRFENAHGEDALNIYGAEFLLDRVTIDGVASDAFDGDFVTGVVRDCTFARSVEDAVDVSGSDVEVVDCTFVEIGDKCVSAGEDSTARVRGGVVESASIAIASKDFSRVDVEGMQIKNVTNYALAAYIKKPEFGASTIVARDMSFGDVGRGIHIVQDPCELELDGARIAGVEVDVDDLYQRKILGQ